MVAVSGIESFVFIYLESWGKLFVRGTTLSAPLTLSLTYLKQHLAEEEYDSGEVAGLRLVKYPHPSLRAKNDVITEFSNDLQQLSRSMFEVRSVRVMVVPYDGGNILFRRLLQLLSPHDLLLAFGSVVARIYIYIGYL